MQYGYDALAEIYDQFNNGFDYRDYFQTIKIALSGIENPFGNKIALDCGCGTGSLMELLSEEGFDCTGVDLSAEMLEEARKKPLLENARLICQDLSKIDLYRAYDLAFCSLDTINHLTEKRKLQTFFSRIYYFVEENGFFIFDIKTKKAFQATEGLSVFHEEDSVLIFENSFRGSLFGQSLTAFQKQPEGAYQKIESYVEERFYTPAEITAMMQKTPFVRYAKIPYRERILYIYRKLPLSFPENKNLTREHN